MGTGIGQTRFPYPFTIMTHTDTLVPYWVVIIPINHTEVLSDYRGRRV